VNTLPTWPCNYPVVQQKEEVVSKKVKKKAKPANKAAKKLSKTISTTIDLDDVYTPLGEIPFPKEQFISSLDNYIQKLTTNIQTKGLNFSNSNLEGVHFIVGSLDNPEDVIGF
jgi:hypothetical protein